MIAVYNKETDSYGIVGLNKDEMIDLVNVFNCCSLSEKRTFFNVKESVKELIK